MADNIPYEDRYEHIYEMIQTGIVLIDTKTHKIVDINPIAIEMIGIDKDIIIGKECHNFICSAEKGKCPITDLKEQKDRSKRELITSSGRVIPILKTVVPITLSGRSYLLESFIDLRKLKSDGGEDDLLLKRLDQSQKIESLGTLAGGIAHDFNNILYAAIGFTELALADVAAGSRAEACLLHIMTAHKRATDLINQILTFSRKSSKEIKPVYLQPIIKEALKLLGNAIPANIAITHMVDKDCGPVLSDPTKIHQVIMNLCTNAYQAMQKKGGRMIVKLTKITAGLDPIPPGLNLKKGSYLILEVTDTGIGIPDETKERIFEPFFTTKDVGGGTGMGLSTVHGIVKDNGGAIHVESRLGHGTSFYVFFPEGSPDEIVDSEIYEIIDLKGSEKILFVDDEAQITLLVEKTLKKHGYTVYTCTSSVEALEIFRLAPNHFDIVVTDYNMPGLTGIELAKGIINIRPDIPVLLCSGYPNEAIEEEAYKIGVKGIQEKPVVTEDLLKAIRRVVNS